ncbi:DUF6686 family protein [Maribacter sp. 2307ULW6-5]|uniref:DUF6686 family protein n=1 Tax=Maribacter sp. 2307ULW6-5 TaxID=3386275 RepID=UPI0039BCEB4E
MCRNINVLKRTRNGSMAHCGECKMYHLLFGQFALEFTAKELNHFGKFLMQLDADPWEQQHCNCTSPRKIAVATLQQNLQLLLNRNELEELKSLVFFKERPDPDDRPLHPGEIDYTFILN